MTDEEIIRSLRDAAGSGCTPVQLANLLDELTGGGLSQGSLVTYFKRAFPAVPLRALLDAGAWHRVSGGGMSDEQFEALLGSFLHTPKDGVG